MEPAPREHRLELTIGIKPMSMCVIEGGRLMLIDTGMADTPCPHVFPDSVLESLRACANRLLGISLDERHEPVFLGTSTAPSPSTPSQLAEPVSQILCYVAHSKTRTSLRSTRGTTTSH